MTNIAERLYNIRDQLRTGRFGQREEWEHDLEGAAAEIKRLTTLLMVAADALDQTHCDGMAVEIRRALGLEEK